MRTHVFLREPNAEGTYFCQCNGEVFSDGCYAERDFPSAKLPCPVSLPDAARVDSEHMRRRDDEQRAARMERGEFWDGEP